MVAAETPTDTATAYALDELDGNDVQEPRVSVVIPAMNEARNLPHVFEHLPANLHEVILGRRPVDRWHRGNR